MEEVGTLTTSVGDYSFSQAQVIEEIHANVDRFVSEELVQDAPTGELLEDGSDVVYLQLPLTVCILLSGSNLASFT